jgi:hypothetical protein
VQSTRHLEAQMVYSQNIAISKKQKSVRSCDVNLAFPPKSFWIADWRLSQSGDPLKSRLSSCSRKVAMATLIASGMVTTEGIGEEPNGISRNELLKRKPWVKGIDQMGAGPNQLFWPKIESALARNCDHFLCWKRVREVYPGSGKTRKQ